MKIKCPFCPIEKSTEKYFETDDGIVVCKDLKNKGYKYRILVVGSGKHWHRTKDAYEYEEFERFKDLGMKIARKHIKEKKAKKIARIDMTHLTYPQHWHLQFCMV